MIIPKVSAEPYLSASETSSGQIKARSFRCRAIAEPFHSDRGARGRATKGESRQPRATWPPQFRTWAAPDTRILPRGRQHSNGCHPRKANSECAKYVPEFRLPQRISVTGAKSSNLPTGRLKSRSAAGEATDSRLIGCPFQAAVRIQSRLNRWSCNHFNVPFMNVIKGASAALRSWHFVTKNPNSPSSRTAPPAALIALPML